MSANYLPPRKSKKGWRKIIPIFIPLLIMIILLTAESIISQSPQLRTTTDWYNAMFGLVIININIILILVLLVVIFRHLIKLFVERKRRILGSRFRTKLVLTMLAVIIVPTALVYVISSDLISKGIERWYESSVEEIVRSSEHLSGIYLEDYEELVTSYANRISERMGGNDFERYQIATPNQEADLVDATDAITFDVLQIYKGTELYSPIVVNPESPLLQNIQPQEPEYLERLIASFEEDDTEIEIWREHFGNGTMIYAASPIEVEREENDNDVAGVVVLGLSINRDLEIISRDIGAYYQRYREQIDNRHVVNTASQGLLLIFTLISVFSAIWVGIYFSRGITGPIQQLAEGTRAVAGGNLDYQVETRGDDELAVLISSFNEMTRDLKESKEDLENANRNLMTTNQELERRRRYTETLLANLSTAVISLDDDGIITTENAAALELLQLPWSSQVGSHWQDVFKEKNLAPVRELLERYFENNKHYLKDQIKLRTQRGVLNVSATVTSIRREDGGERGVLIVLEDLTELARAQRTAAWQEVAQRVAHEIKNPLTPIQLSAERIRRKVILPSNSTEADGNGKEQGNGRQPVQHFDLISQATNTIIEETGILKSIVDAFSSFARMPQVELAPDDVNLVLEKASSIYSSDPEGNGFVIHKRFADDLPDVELDPNQLKMAFVNIIINAIDAMQGQGDLTISTWLDGSRNTVNIAFADQGPGIPPETREKLFMPYFSTKKKGTGLGLAIVSRIISEHHGSITVDDNEGQGARFIIELPAI